MGKILFLAMYGKCFEQRKYLLVEKIKLTHFDNTVPVIQQCYWNHLAIFFIFARFVYFI